MNEFDIKAKEWDKNQMHIDRTKAIASSLRKTIPLSKSMNALEYGAGTALLSLELKDLLRNITLMDSSEEMIKIMKAKSEGENMHPVLFNLEEQDYPGKFNIIYSQMVLHHVDKINRVLRRFHSMLTNNGYLAIADLYTENGSFHGEGFTGHKGFDPSDLAEQLKSIGFKNIRFRPCYTMTKIVNPGITKDFPIFLLTAVK